MIDRSIFAGEISTFGYIYAKFHDLISLLRIVLLLMMEDRIGPFNTNSVNTFSIAIVVHNTNNCSRLHLEDLKIQVSCTIINIKNFEDWD